MIEPPVRFIERHCSRRNSLQNVHAWTPAALGIWKLLEQTTAKCVQKPLLLPHRISFCVQPSLLAANLKRPQFHSYAFHGLWTRALHHPKNVLPDLLQVVLEFHFGLLFCHAQPFRNLFPRKAVLSRHPNFPRPTIHTVCDLSDPTFDGFQPPKVPWGRSRPSRSKRDRVLTACTNRGMQVVMQNVRQIR